MTASIRFVRIAARTASTSAMSPSISFCRSAPPRDARRPDCRRRTRRDRPGDLLIPSITLDDYVTRAIQQGVQGKENAWALESAGYTREATFRQTDSPTLTLGHTHTRGDIYANHVDSISESKQSTLTLNELTPLGTVISAAGQYGDANNGANGGIGKPGLTASVTQPLYLFVRNSVLRTRRQAELNFVNARDTFDSTVLSLQAQARSFYYNVMLGEESIGVEERKVAATKKLLEVTQALVRAGKSAPVETMRAKIRLQTSERSLQNVTTTRDKAILSRRLHLVGQEQRDDLRALDGLGDRSDRDTGVLGSGPRGASLAQPDDDVDPGVVQVEGVGVTLAPVADDGDLPVEQPQVAVPVNSCHSMLSLPLGQNALWSR